MGVSPTEENELTGHQSPALQGRAVSAGPARLWLTAASNNSHLLGNAVHFLPHFTCLGMQQHLLLQVSWKMSFLVAGKCFSFLFPPPPHCCFKWGLALKDCTFVFGYLLKLFCFCLLITPSSALELCWGQHVEPRRLCLSQERSSRALPCAAQKQNRSAPPLKCTPVAAKSAEEA